MTGELKIFPDKQSLSRAVAEAFVDSADRLVSEHHRFSVALAGGGTPRLLYELLSGELRKKIPWAHVHFFLSDERYVPRDHPDSNYRLVREAMLVHVAMPPENLHFPRTDFEEPEAAARHYEQSLASFFAPAEPRFDWILLGLGEDGHLASLFPGSSALDETERWVVAVKDSPKPPPVRLTMTLPLINLAGEVHFLVSGREKAEALRSSREGPPNPGQLPAHGVKPQGGGPELVGRRGRGERPQRFGARHVEAADETSWRVKRCGP